MSDLSSTGPSEVAPGEGTPEAPGIPRAAFLKRAGLGAAFLLGAASSVVGSALSSGAATAAGKGSTAASRIGLWLGNVRAMKPNQSLAYTDPASGDPAVLIRLATGQYVSYDAVCTHAGCTVPYDPARKLLVCPCHGARYDPARGAAVVGGPAPQPLRRLPVRVDVNGNVYALDAKPSRGQAVNRLHQPPPPSKSGENDDAGSTRKHRRGSDDGGD